MNQVKAIRERLGVTQKMLGAGIGCTQSNVGHYECGQTVPPDMAEKLIIYATCRGLTIGFDHIYGNAPVPDLARTQELAHG